MNSHVFLQTCLHPLCRKFPPSVRYRRLFLSQLIRRVRRGYLRLLVELFLSGQKDVEILDQSQTWLCASWFLPPQLEASGCEPLDELYDALAEVVGAEETTECYKSYLLVPHTENPQCHCYLYIQLLVLSHKNIKI